MVGHGGTSEVQAADDVFGPLTKEERRRLVTFKARYVLRTQGFSPSQAARLLFLKWMVERGRVTG